MARHTGTCEDAARGRRAARRRVREGGSAFGGLGATAAGRHGRRRRHARRVWQVAASRPCADGRDRSRRVDQAELRTPRAGPGRLGAALGLAKTSSKQTGQVVCTLGELPNIWFVLA